MAKQQYLLDFDDKLSSSFMTPQNAQNLIDGLNASGVQDALGVAVGGLGSNSFAAGQTIVFDGEKMVSSGLPAQSPTALMNDDRYYTKAQVDALFASLGEVSGPAVAYSNIIGAPAPGAQLQFITPVTVATLSSVMSSPVQYSIAPIAGHTIVGALLTATVNFVGNGLTKILVSATASSPTVDLAWYQEAGTGNTGYANASGQVVPVDASSQSFYYQLTGTPVGSAVIKLVGYFFV